MASKNKVVRNAAVAGDGTGSARYGLLKAGAEQASKSFSAGCYIESIMLTEGMLWCRVASRYHYVVKKPAAERQFLWQLAQDLQATEAGPDAMAFCDVFGRIQKWLEEFRNPLAHAAAKLLDKAESGFAERMREARTGAEVGFRILVDLETLDLMSRLANGWRPGDATSEVRPPASHPAAFDSIRTILRCPSATQVLADRRLARRQATQPTL